MLFIIILGICILYTITRYSIAVVEGNSMLPTYENEDILLIKRFPKLVVGDIYVFYRIREDEKKVVVVKRLTQISDMNYLFFEGDNPEASYDSREYGWINKKQVIAKVIKKL